MKFENTRTYGFEAAIRGMRNPLNSWHLGDSEFGIKNVCYFDDSRSKVAEAWTKSKPEEAADPKMFDYYSNWLLDNGIIYNKGDLAEYAFIGPNDMRLAQRLIAGGTEHRKFLRQIFVSVDITAPIYWWKEADTYKVSTTANSTSTMHKLAATPITLECFETGDFSPEGATDFIIKQLIPYLESLRFRYNETKDPVYWKELVRWLPQGWLQTRTWTANYEVIRSMLHQRENHKLVEWRQDFVSWARSLPYAKEFLLTI